MRRKWQNHFEEKNSHFTGFLCIVLLLILIFLPGYSFTQTIQSSIKVKNLIILVPDGCGTAHMTVSRWLKGAPLAQDSLYTRLVSNYSANSVITGSAAAASAFATGFKTWEDGSRAKCISILPDSLVIPIPQKLPADRAWHPVATLLEASRLSGRSTGLVATSVLPHATPAAFSAHWHDRDNLNVIMEQQVHQNIDVVFAGGRAHLFPPGDKGGSRDDGEDLSEELKLRGYSLISSRNELTELSSSVSKVWGMFASGSLQGDLDRHTFAKEQPSLAECTKKAIELLSKNKKGFFLMVEGSQVDWFSHANDPVGVATEYLAFDAAVTAALEFARKNGDTEVLVFPDHDNGGMSLGQHGDDYTSITPELVVNPLKNCTLTCRGLLDSLIRYAKGKDPVTWNDIGPHIKSIMNIETLNVEDTLIDIPYSVNNSKTDHEDIAKIGTIISKRAHIGWTTHGHTGNNIPMYSLLLNSQGIFDNTDVAKYCEGILELDLKKTTDSLMVPAGVEFPSDDYVLIIDSTGVNNGGGLLVVKKETVTISIPFNKDYFMAGSYVFRLPGIVLYSVLNNTVYLPKGTRKLFDQVDPSRILNWRISNKGVLNNSQDAALFFTLNGCKVKKSHSGSGMNKNKTMSDYSTSSGCYIVKNNHNKITPCKMSVVF